MLISNATVAPAHVITAARSTKPASGPSFSVLHAFGPMPDGKGPLGGVVLDTSGEVFGTTSQGGAYGYGTVFELAPSGSTYTETIVHSFDGKDGYYPVAAPLLDFAGDVFVTAAQGGQFGLGTALKFVPTSGGGYRRPKLHSFGSGDDGQGPSAPFIQVGPLLYASTYGGGANGAGAVVVFDAASFREKSVLSFVAGETGAEPESPLYADRSGAIYGSTSVGGPASLGTIFKLYPKRHAALDLVWTPQGQYYGYNGVTLDASGNLYTTVVAGGTNNAGFVIKLTRTNRGYSQTVLHAFEGQSDGSNPNSGLALVGNTLYGTTFGGGANGGGTIFEISTSGQSYAVDYNFGSDGTGPCFGTLFPAGGSLYGTAADGGAGGNGVVFRFTP